MKAAGNTATLSGNPFCSGKNVKCIVKNSVAFDILIATCTVWIEKPFTALRSSNMCTEHVNRLYWARKGDINLCLVRSFLIGQMYHMN